MPEETPEEIPPEDEELTEDVSGNDLEEEIKEIPPFEIMDLEAYGSMRNMLYSYALTYALPGSMQEQINEASENGEEEIDLYVNSGTAPENLVILDDVKVTLHLEDGGLLAPAGQIYNGSLSTITVFGELVVEGNGTIAPNGVEDARGITVADGGHLTMNGGTIEGFDVEGNGGGILVENKGTCTINGGTFANNTAKYYGGGLFAYDAASVTLAGGTWNGNRAENGGGIAFNKATGGSFVFDGIQVENNTATENGGGVYVEEAMKGALLQGTSVNNNTAKVGGGMYFVNGAELTMPENGNVTVNGNSATAGSGGGLWLGQDSNFTLAEGNTITGNRAEGVKNGTKGGGLYIARRSTFTMTGGEISENHALTHGGGIALDCENNYRSSFFMSGGTIRGNSIGQEDLAQTALYGGGVFVNKFFDKVEISGEDTLVTENKGASHGGGLFVWDSGNQFLLKGGTISYNEAKTNNLETCGGGLYCSSPGAIEGGVIEHNYSLVYGGGAYTSSITMKGGEIRDNRAGSDGGGLRANTFTMEGGRICQNTSGNYGGGIRCYSLVMEGGEVDHNTSSSWGGGIMCWDGSYATVNGGSIHDNIGKGSNGGGLATNRTFTMTGGEIYGNITPGQGGGVYISGGYTHTMTGGKIYGNTATGVGGGVASVHGFFKMSGGEIYENKSTADWGGGIYAWSDSTYWKGCDGRRLEISGNAVIRDNTANGSGGGIGVNWGSALIKGGEITGNMTVTGDGGGIIMHNAASELTITGGVVKDNLAKRHGKDICILGGYVAGKDRTHYTICPAKEMTGASEGSCWIDENTLGSNNRLRGEIDNQSILDENIKKEEKDGVLVETAESQKWSRYGAYTFSEKAANTVARVGDTLYSSVQDAVDAIADGEAEDGDRTIVMVADSREAVVIPEKLEATLDLAGHTLRGEDGSVIEVKEEADLTIMDSSEQEGKAGTGAIRGGSGKRISGTDKVIRSYGGGLYIAGTVTLASGSIRNNAAEHGAVYISKNGTFRMEGGSIEDNNGYGVGVYHYTEAGTKDVTAKFDFSGGKICKNIRGVNMNNNNVAGPEMIMSGGEISGHKITASNTDGAGVWLSGGKFTMSGGKITGNECTANGGGIYAYNSNTAVVIEGGEISGNKAVNGGGIRGNSASITIKGGVIKSNSASTGGGVYKNDSGAFKMEGGEISGNEATTGGGIYLWNCSLNGTGGRIQGNKATYGGAIQANCSYSINMVNMGKDSTMVITGNEASVTGGGIAYNTNGSAAGASFTMQGGAIYGNMTKLHPSDLYFTARVTIKEILPAKDMKVEGEKYKGWYDHVSDQFYEETKSLKDKKITGTCDLAATTEMLSGDGICKIIDRANSGETEETPEGSEQTGAPEGVGTEKTYASVAKAIGEIERRKAEKPDAVDSLVIQLLDNIPEDYRESVEIPEGLKVTIDLNGKTLKPQIKDHTFYVRNGAKLYLENGTLSGEGMEFSRGIRVAGGDAESRLSWLHMNGVTLQDFNTEDEGGGIYATGYWGIDLKDVVVENCSAEINGGGICAKRAGWRFKGNFEMKDSRVENCSAGQNGGGVYVYFGNVGGNGEADLAAEGVRQITIDGCQIRNNTAETNYGGGVRVEVQDAWRYIGLTVKGNTVINGNTARDSGGLSVQNVLWTEISDTDISGNRTTGGACGGMRLDNSGTNARKVSLHNVSINDNIADGGGCGGAYIKGKTDISDCTFNGNKVVSRNDCGGLQVAGEMNIRDTEISRNSAKDTGGLFISNREVTEPVSLKNVRVEGNYARNNYGGIYIQQSTYKSATANGETVYTGRPFIFEDCSISDNECGNGSGGGIGFYYMTRANVDFVGTRIAGNRCSSFGGGLWFSNGTAYGTMTLGEGTVIEENWAGNSGGGLFFDGYNNNRHTLRIGDGASIRNNTAQGSGGGIYARIVDIEMTGGEISGNTAAYGGGIYCTYHNWWSDGNTVMNYRNTGFHMTGGKITGNRASTDGGGLYLASFCGNDLTNIDKLSTTHHGDPIVVSGGEITGNSAGRWGGGVAESVNGAYFRLEEGGKVYDNSAALAQDIYGHYASGNRPARLSLISAADMFGADDSGNRKGIGWFDESANRTIKEEIKGELKTRYYALTLLYDNGQYVAEIGEDRYTSVQEAVDAVRSGRYSESGEIPTVKMIDDSVENVEIPSGVELVLNLNGKKLQGHSTAITCAGRLTIRDEKDPGVTSTGTITGFGVEAGGGIHVLRNGYVTMESGQVANCYGGTGYTNSSDTTKGGAAVAVEAGTFLLAGGSLNHNNAKYGAAVLVCDNAGRFRMTGGFIEENTGNYGAVFVTRGVAEISGGELRNNKMSGTGGAVYLQSGRMYIRGTEKNPVKITGNEAADRGGGGLYMENGTANIKYAEISGNKATGAKRTDVTLSAGGGIYVYGGRLNIGTETVITRNSAIRGGGLYQVNGTVHMIGGEILKNTAQMGGGVAQNPITKGVFVMMEGGVYDNLSRLSSSGNDFYSRYEGDQDVYDEKYKGKGNVPSLTVTNAETMGNPNYNVWRDDTYTVKKGETDKNGKPYSRLGNMIGEGQYVKADIKVSYNVELTAAHYDTEAIETDLLTGKEVGDLLIGPRVSDEKGVQKTTTGTGGFDTKARAEEKTASEKMAEDPEAWMEEDGFIKYTGSEEKYQKDHGNGTGLYEPEQMADWESGSDSTEANTLVRTFDTVNYPFVITIKDSEKTPDVSDGNPGVSDNDVKALEKEDGESNPNGFYRIWFEASLPAGADLAEFVLTEGAPVDMTHYTVEPVGEDMQILNGYWDVPAKDCVSGSTFNRAVKIRINGMHDGDTLQPEFTCWMSGSENVVKEAASERLTVSAMAKYNVTLDYHEGLSYSGYFNVETGEEASQKEMQADPEHVKFGTILGYGVTAELYNDGTGKGIKGIEVPADGMQFDLRFKGSLYMDGNAVKDADGNSVTAAPYIWAYKENEKGNYGKVPGSTDIRNMMWDDEDDLAKVTDYAYNAAPFNSGGGNNGCYNGGSWVLDAPVMEGDETVVHATISGYSVNYTDTNPDRASNGSQSGTLGSLIKNSYVKPFSAGYVQVFYPVDEAQVKTSGYLTIAMQAAITGTTAQSASEGPAMNGNGDEYDLDDLKFYFGKNHLEELEEGIATGEVFYKDNYSNHQFGMYMFKGNPLVALSSAIGKTNYFLNTSKLELSGQEGSASTPLMSTVYLGGSMNYSSRPIRTDDPTGRDKDYYIPDDEFNTQSDNKTEYEYLTALNILQKFDAEAYTPIGYPNPVIGENYNFDNKIGGRALTGFHITNSETGTSWSATKTKNAKLTILYGAKPDGSNWIKGEPLDNEVYDYEKNGDKDKEYDDGGVRDMDAHREKDLIYFETMEELNRYFEAQGIEGKCVAILYELRDCCIRNGRSVSASAGMQVGNDLALTGNTYCTTNDAYGWANYRPVYKQYFTKYYNSKDPAVKEKFFEILHNETLENTEGVVLEENGVTVYKPLSAKPVEPEKPAEPEGNGQGSEAVETTIDVKLQPLPTTREYWDGYIKTQYVNGRKVGGTHNGWISGNTLLVKTLDPSILINGADTIKGSGGASSERIKESYNVTKGERVAKFEVRPSLGISAGLDKHYLVSTGILSTGIKIDITLPEKMAYVDKSITYDYEKSDYKEGELVWKEVETETIGGKTVLHLYTNITDLGKKLPKINFETFLGTTNIAEENNDVRDGQVMTLNAAITPIYEMKDQDQMAAKTTTDSCSIIIERKGNNGGYATVDKRVVEVGEDLVYNLNYRSGTDESGIELIGVLPYNGDGRDTRFSGGYRVEKIEVTFSEEADYNAYLQGVASSLEGSGLEPGELRYLTGQVVPGQKLPGGTEERKEADIRRDLSQGTPFAATQPEGNTNTVTYLIGQDIEKDFVQKDENAYGIGLYAKIPQITKGNGVTVKVTLSPKQAGADESEKLGVQLIKGKGDAVQNGGDTYGEDFFFTTSALGGATVPASKGLIQTVKRSVSGRIWMDQKHDGVYEAGNASNPNDDRTVKEMEVKLYRVVEESGKTTYEPATNVYGDNASTVIVTKNGKQEQTPVRTDANGMYLFEDLPAGEYQVVLQGIGKGYKIADKTGRKGDITPISFGRLSVTTLGNVTVRPANANYALPYYEVQDGSDKPAELKAVHLTGNIDLPTTDRLSTADYASGNWNMGLYYLDQTIVKNWINMAQDDVEKEYGATFEITGTYAKAEGIAPDDSLTEGDADGYVLTYEMSGKGADTKTVRIDSKGAAKEAFDDGRTGTDENKYYTKFTKSVTPATLPEDGTQTYTWKLENLALQAEGASGKITYTVEENEAFEKQSAFLGLGSSKEGLNGFITETEATGDKTTVRSFTADNTQVLYKIDVTKIGELVDGSDIDNGFVKWLGEEGAVTQPGTKFGIYSDEDCKELLKEVGPEADSAVSSFMSMPAKTYYVKEMHAPLFYKINLVVFKLEIRYPEKTEGEELKPSATAVPTVTLTKEGETEPKVLTAESTAFTPKGQAKNYQFGFDVKDNPVLGTINVHKVDSDGKSLTGVTFKLTCSDRGSEKTFRVLDENGESTTVNEVTRTTDGDGKLSFAGLTPGTYILTEAETSDGNSLLMEPVTITVPLKMSKAEADKQNLRTKGEDVIVLNDMCYFYTLNYEISNEAVLKLPETGGVAGAAPIAAVALLLMAGGYLVIRRRRKEKGNA